MWYWLFVNAICFVDIAVNRPYLAGRYYGRIVGVCMEIIILQAQSRLVKLNNRPQHSPHSRALYGSTRNR